LTRVLLLSRSVHWGLSTAVAMWCLAVLIGRRAIEIDLSFPPTKVVVVELCVVVTATILAIVTRSRFWAWDRVAHGARSRAVAGVVAGLVIVLSVLCVPVVVPWLPTDAAWTWVMANALVLSATVLLLVPLLTPLLAGAVVTVLWFASAIVTNVAPGVWLPLTNYRDQDGHWVVATVLVVAAVVAHARTCGMTAWTHRQS